MANQYDVLGKAPGLEDLNKLSPNDVHLTIRGLNAGYGKMEILHNFDLTVSKAQSLCLIGPNGAGKSTILHSIYGFTNIFDGKIELEGNEITKLTPAEKLSKVGIAYILQDNSVFPDMTVEENGSNFFSKVFCSWAFFSKSRLSRLISVITSIPTWPSAIARSSNIKSGRSSRRPDWISSNFRRGIPGYFSTSRSS